MESSVKVKRIEKVDETLIHQIHSLLDEGTVWDLEQGAQFLADRDNALFLAFWKDQAAGFLVAHRLQRFDSRRAEVLLYEVGVREDLRRQGIGRALLEEVKKWAREVQADEVWVLTNKSYAAANALYTSAGGKVENPDDVMYVFTL